MMKYLGIGSIFLFLVVFGSCDYLENNKTNRKKSDPIDWKNALQKATTFSEETQLLKTLIQQDSSNTHQRLIANRLQTFDLRHLKEAEKLTILDLYELSLQPTKQPSETILQIAYAKLSATYPTNNELTNAKIEELIESIKELAGTDLEL